MISRIREKLAYSNRFMSVYFDEVILADGKLGRYTRVRSGAGFPGVVILPLRDGQVGLVRQYRYPVSRDMWELPRGAAHSIDTEFEARRELAEETGAVDAQLISLGVVHPDSGLLETEVALFLANLPASSPFGAVDEVDEARWVRAGDLVDLVAHGHITDAFTVAAVSRAHIRGLLG